MKQETESEIFGAIAAMSTELQKAVYDRDKLNVMIMELEQQRKSSRLLSFRTRWCRSATSSIQIRAYGSDSDNFAQA